MIVRRRELENKVEALVFRDVSSSSPSCSSKLAGEYGVDDAPRHARRAEDHASKSSRT